MNHDEMKAFFQNDRFAVMIGAQIDSIAADEVVCSLTLEEHHMNAGGNTQGGVTFTLADYAFGLAANYDAMAKDQKAASVSQSFHITYLAPPAGKRLIAKTRCLRKGGKLSVYQVTVTDDLGTQVAEVTGNAYRVFSK